MNLSICLLSAIPVRKEPSHRSEMVSQLLFGEYAEPGKEEGDFVSIKCVYDGYEGWVQANQLLPIAAGQVLTTDRYIGAYEAGVRINSRLRHLPFGTPVFDAEGTEAVIFGNHHIQYGALDIWSSQGQVMNEAALQQIAAIYLDTPYFWGGKSIYGIDCSGFAQQVFKLFGIKLLRDAYQQATQGEEITDLEATRPGDLAFFHNEKGRITHVGIILQDNKIVHASGRVRIDQLDKEGILHLETGKRTHQLHAMRRYF